jgi:phosphatidate phosphatase APP1
MSHLGLRLTSFASRIEARIDTARVRFRLRHGWLDPFRVVVYRGYGTRAALHLRGRVVSRKSVGRPTRGDSAWRNLQGMYRRFTGEEIPGATVRVHFAGDPGPPTEAITDEEGYFTITHALPTAGSGWHEATVELIQPTPHSQPSAPATGDVLIPPPGAAFGVISDIDDTIVQTGATSLLTMARIVLLSNAHTCLPFQGIAAFYTALERGATGQGRNPLFYVSSSPWNLYDVLVLFLAINKIPAGPLFLQDWGLGRNALIKTSHRDHKRAVIATLLATYPDLPFVLIGDSGEQDAEIYREAAREHPGRILAIYIRDTQLQHRATAVRAIAEELRAGPAPLLLASDTVAAAEHAADNGLIHPDTLPAILADKARDLLRTPRATWRRLLRLPRRHQRDRQVTN